jgi:uncharacterized membrane protein YdbT with pleckstrin-like domain
MNQATGLMQGEQVVFKGKIHWIIFIPSAIVLAIGEALMLGWSAGPGMGKVILTLGAFFFFRAFMTYNSNEVIITDKRLILKHGIIAQHIFISPLKNIEAVNMRKPIFGAFLDYGTITISGTGKSSATIHHLRQPESFQQAMNGHEVSK